MLRKNHANAYVEQAIAALVLILSLFLLLNACGGGGGGGGSTPPPSNPVPSITSLSPSTIDVGAAATTVTINGTGFVQSSTAEWNGSSLTTTYVSATELQATLPAADLAAVGTGKIVVVNPAPGGGTSSSSSISIVYPVPAITSLSPNSVAWNSSSTALTVTGTGFEASSVVQLNGPASPTTYVNSTTLTTTISAANLGNGATASVTVFTGTPGGGTSSAVTLAVTYPVPAITSVTPASIPVNSPATSIIVQGTGLTQNSTIEVNGTPAGQTEWSQFNPSSIGATVPASDLTSVGSLSVTVTNPGVATSNALTLAVSPNPVPAISSVSPNSAAIAGAGFTLTVEGSNFVAASTVQWNGSTRPTTYGSDTQLTATINASDTQSLGNQNVTVTNPSPGGGVTAAIPFTTYLAIPANGLVYSPNTQLLYVSVPSSGGPTLGNSIVPIDPYTGNLGTPVWVGSEPGIMAQSSDDGTIWVGLTGAAAARELNLNTMTAGLQFNLGGGTGVYNAPSTATALAVMPGFPNTLAVAGGPNDVAIYDSGVARADTQAGAQCCSGTNGMAFDPTGTMLYEAGNGYGVATVNGTGITAGTYLNANVNSNSLDIDNGRAYLTSGVILNAATGAQLGVFTSQGQNANGPVASDSALGEGFVLVNPSGYQINVYDLSTFDLNGSIPAEGVDSFLQNPSSLLRWGQNGLAFTSGSQVYVLTSPLVQKLSSSVADLSVTANAPAVGTTGTNLTYTLTVTDAGPVTAAPATLVDTLPTGATLQSVTPSQGGCNSGPVLSCNLGNVTSGSSATVAIVLTPLTNGTLTNTATVSAPEADPNLANNTVVSNTAVTGPVYTPAPVVTGISPSTVQAGSGPFTLTVNGSGFGESSAIQLNSTAVSTTFVSSSQLTATVGASTGASMGWFWVSVNNPAPGGGTSSSLPLTFYSVISLDINRMLFDPYTRKLYATVPSTATQVAGNSLVAIDPSTGTIGTPINVGSGPDPLKESSDGDYVFIGLDGAESLTSVNLTTVTQGPTFPLTLPASNTQFAARDLAVAPGDDNLLAIDAGSYSGIGLLDISGSTAAMRANLTGPYTGSLLNFANPTTLYSYDTDTSGALFNIWTVTSTGLTLNNGTGYTLNGIGGFSGGYQLLNNVVYGFDGGVDSLTTLPPVPLGQYEIPSAQGQGQVIEGSGVCAIPSYGRTFFLGETLAGSANPVLLSYDINRYVLLGMQQFTGAAQGEDLVQWGRDGLAWHSSNGGAFGNNTPGAGQLFLMRGPFVLPQWSTANAAPSLASVSPSSTSAGSGNMILTVTGSGFVPGAVLQWNGAERTTTFVGSTQLTVAIPASDVSQAGTATLTVNSPGSGNSSSVTFTIN